MWDMESKCLRFGIGISEIPASPSFCIMIPWFVDILKVYIFVCVWGINAFGGWICRIWLMLDRGQIDNENSFTGDKNKLILLCKQRDPYFDLKSGISSINHLAPRCSIIPWIIIGINKCVTRWHLIVASNLPNYHHNVKVTEDDICKSVLLSSVFKHWAMAGQTQFPFV